MGMSISEAGQLQVLETRLRILTEVVAEMQLRLNELATDSLVERTDFPDVAMDWKRGPGRPRKNA
jgi:hypothetical protein